jgi:hypothetical protein
MVMAELEVRDGEQVLNLSDLETVEGIHGDLGVPLTAVRGIEPPDDAPGMARIAAGFTVGMRVPGRAAVASVRKGRPEMFIAIHHDTPRAVRVLLDGTAYDERVVGADYPESVIEGLGIEL